MLQRKDSGGGGEQERTVAGFPGIEHGSKPGVDSGMKPCGRRAQEGAHRTGDICSARRGNHHAPVD